MFKVVSCAVLFAQSSSATCLKTHGKLYNYSGKYVGLKQQVLLTTDFGNYSCDWSSSNVWECEGGITIKTLSDATNAWSSKITLIRQGKGYSLLAIKDESSCRFIDSSRRELGGQNRPIRKCSWATFEKKCTKNSEVTEFSASYRFEDASSKKISVSIKSVYDISSD